VVEGTHRPASALVDQYLRDAKLSQLRALLLVYEHGTASAAAKAANEPYNSLSAQLRAANDWFVRHTGADLIDFSSGRLTLTQNGQWVAAQARTIEGLLEYVLQGLKPTRLALQIPCTSDCIEDLARVVRAMPPEAASFFPLAVETAHFDPLICGDIVAPVLSFGSKYMAGSRLALPDYIEVLVYRQRPIVAIMNDPNAPFPHGGPAISIQELLQSHARVMTSIGGVIWDFFEEHAPSVTHGLRNGMHVPVHDLHIGLKILASQIVPLGTMLVHGVERELAARSPKYPILEHLACFSLTESDEGRDQAVTALFYNRRSADKCHPNVRDAYSLFWQTASAIKVKG